MHIDIFCESGQKYGLGHFYRCIKLLHLCTLPQVSSITLHNRGDYIPPPLETLLPLQNPWPKHIALKCKCYEWLDSDFQHFKNLDLVIIDSYESGKEFYDFVQQKSKALICLDDTFRDVYPPTSIILNPAPNAKVYLKSYQNLWCGIEFMIPPQIPTAYSDFQTNIDSKDHTPRIFLNFGGVDSSNLTQSALQSIATYIDSQISHTNTSINIAHSESRANSIIPKSPSFHIVLGGGYPHTLQIPKCLQHHSFVYHALSPNAFLALAQSCDYALSAGGGSMLELISLRIPSVIIQSASNQQFHIAQYAKLGVIIPTHNMQEATQNLFALLEQKETYHKLIHTLHSFQIGTLLPQALQSLIDSLQPKESNIAQKTALQTTNFCQLNQEQAKLVCAIRNHKSVGQWMYSKNISPQMHEDFLHNLKGDKAKQYWLLHYEDDVLGVGSLTRINLTHRYAFLGIYTNPFSTIPHKGMQILEFLESMAFGELGLHTIHLEVLEHNTRALRFYEKMGYKQEGRLTELIYRDGRYYDVILMNKKAKEIV